MELIQKICGWILDFLTSSAQSYLNTIFKMSTNIFNQISFDFWSNEIIGSFLSLSQWANWLIYCISFVFALFDAAEEAGSMKQIDWTAMVANFMKGSIFVAMYSYLAIGTMQAANLLTRFLSIQINVSDLNEITGGIIASMSGFVSDLFLSMLLGLAVLIAVIGFIFISIKRFGAMLVQIFASAFYIPDIVRGESTKVGDWLRQTLAIAFTYTFQYILFYCGFSVLMDPSGTVDVIMGFGLWLSISAVPHLLAKFGQSSGVKGGMGLGSLASQGLSLMLRK